MIKQAGETMLAAAADRGRDAEKSLLHPHAGFAESEPARELIAA